MEWSRLLIKRLIPANNAQQQVMAMERLDDMMRNICCIFGLILMILLLCACGSDGSADSNMPEDGSWVSGRYLRVDQTSFIVTGAMDITSMSAKNENVSFEGLQNGDEIRVYMGWIGLTWPAQSDIYAVEKVADGDIADISPELLEQLRKLGWSGIDSLINSDSLDGDETVTLGTGEDGNSPADSEKQSTEYGQNLPEDGGWVSGRYLRGKQSDLIVTGDWDVITMGIADEAISFDGLEDGDLIRVYIVCILESWPGQTTVYNVEKVEDGEIQDISSELLEELREMGWLE